MKNGDMATLWGVDTIERAKLCLKVFFGVLIRNLVKRACNGIDIIILISQKTYVYRWMEKKIYNIVLTVAIFGVLGIQVILFCLYNYFL